MDNKRIIDRFHENIRNYIWECGKWEFHGVYRKINEGEVAKFMDFLNSEIIKLKEKLKLGGEGSENPTR